MKISKEAFGELRGQLVSLYTLENDQGVVMKVTNYGCTVTSLVVPDSHGIKSDIVCGFDKFESYFGGEYVSNSPYFGCTVGRCAGMIKDGKFSLDGEDYELATNAGSNHLHGGVAGFDKQLWAAEEISADGEVGLVFTLNSPDGQEGYPGNLDVKVIYSLNNENEFSVSYEAATDKKTPLSMTHHTYWNLGGFEDKILDHQAAIHSAQYLAADETGALTGELIPVAGTAADFNTAKKIGDAFDELPLGFEHFYTFPEKGEAFQTVAEFSHEGSGRKLEVSTTEPCMLFYTGRYTSDALRREDGTQYGQFRAFCCEASKYPNGANLSDAPRALIEPGQVYKEKTIYRLSW